MKKMQISLVIFVTRQVLFWADAHAHALPAARLPPTLGQAQSSEWVPPIRAAPLISPIWGLWKDRVSFFLSFDRPANDPVALDADAMDLAVVMFSTPIRSQMSAET